MFSEGGRHADAGEDPASVPHERHSGVQSHAQVDERVVFASRRFVMILSPAGRRLASERAAGEGRAGASDQPLLASLSGRRISYCR